MCVLYFLRLGDLLESPLLCDHCARQLGQSVHDLVERDVLVHGAAQPEQEINRGIVIFKYNNAILASQ